MPYARRLTVTCINEARYSTRHKGLSRRCVEGPGQVDLDWKHGGRKAGSRRIFATQIDAADWSQTVCCVHLVLAFKLA